MEVDFGKSDLVYIYIFLTASWHCAWYNPIYLLLFMKIWVLTLHNMYKFVSDKIIDLMFRFLDLGTQELFKNNVGIEYNKMTFVNNYEFHKQHN